MIKPEMKPTWADAEHGAALAKSFRLGWKVKMTRHEHIARTGKNIDLLP